VKAITVRQPWAWAIATGAKTVENRSRPAPWTSAIDERIAIHAGKGWDRHAITGDNPLVALAHRQAGQMLGNVAVGGVPLAALVTFMVPTFHHRGAVMATAELAGVHPARDCSDVGENGLCSPWAQADSWHLVLRDIRAVREPVACKGALGLWTLPQYVEAQVRSQQQEAAA
jgi:hypothetical protein